MAFRMPAEWAPHERVWIGFPSFAEYWGEPLATAQRQIAAFANAVHDGGIGETVHLIAKGTEATAIARGLVEPGVIVEGRDANILNTIALQSGMLSLYEDGLRKVVAGHTTLDELARVTQDQSDA